MTEFPQREPQESDAAQHDRRHGWSGRITPKAEPCDDMDLMRRVHHGLTEMATSEADEPGQQQ